MNLADLTNPSTNPLPEELQKLVAAMLEGRVNSLMILAEYTDENGDQDWIRGVGFDMEDCESDLYGFLGHLDIMHQHVRQQVEAPIIQIQISGGGDDDQDDD